MNIAVVGCGHWGKNLVRNFAELGCLKVVSDPNESARQQVADLAGDVHVTPEFADTLSPNIDGVAIATPSATHFELARKALDGGKNVFVEKPLALTYAEGLELVSLAERRRLILMVGHVLEYHPAIRRLQELLAAGDLGKIHYLYSNRLSLGRVRREENTLWSFAPHDLAVILRLTQSMPYQVVACGGSYLQPNVPDVTVTNLLFNNGVRAHIFVSWLHPFKEQRLVIVGSKRMASFDDVRKQLVLYDQSLGVGAAPVALSSQKGEEVEFSDDEPLRAECLAFVEAIRSGKPPLTDGYSALRVLQVLEAAQRSMMMNGQPVVQSSTNSGLEPGFARYA